MAALIPRPKYPPYSASGRDDGRIEADALLKKTEEKVHKVYLQAAREMRDKADAYLAGFMKEDEARRKLVDEGKLDAEDWMRWRNTQILQGRRYYEMADTLASDMTQSNKIAAGIINGTLPDVFAIGVNYGLYQGEITGGFETSFSLYDHDTVMRLIREEPDLLPVRMNVNESKDEAWNRKQIASVMTQSIMQGERVDEIASRLATAVAGMNERTAIRNARTAFTSAENGGRYDSFRRLKTAGVDMTVEWCATLDDRTRDEHRMLDGQRQDVGVPFEVDGESILYAGDPYAPQGLIWNCRCTILGWCKGFEDNRIVKASAFPDGQHASYTEWKYAKRKDEESEKKPRVNPNNPSYGYASDFKKNGLTNAGNRDKINNKIRFYNIHEESEHGLFTEEEIEKAMQQSPIGRNASQYFTDAGLSLCMNYDINADSEIDGCVFGKEITVFAANHRDEVEVSETIIHEIAHIQFDWKNTQEDEVNCRIYEYLHTHETISDDTISMIVQQVRQKYSFLPEGNLYGY